MNVYKIKYLKYKNKYLKLKNTMKGGVQLSLEDVNKFVGKKKDKQTYKDFIKIFASKIHIYFYLTYNLLSALGNTRQNPPIYASNLKTFVDNINKNNFKLFIPIPSLDIIYIPTAIKTLNIIDSISSDNILSISTPVINNNTLTFTTKKRRYK